MKLNLFEMDRKRIAFIISKLYGPRTGPEEIIDQEHIKLRVRESVSKRVPDSSERGWHTVHEEDRITYRIVNLGEELEKKNQVLVEDNE